MSFVTVVTDAAAEAAKTLEGIGAGVSAATAAAAAPTAGLAAAAQDEVSTAIASLYGNYGQEFQALSAQAQAFYDRFVGTLGASMGQYVSAEAANAQQFMLNAVSAPAQAAAALPAASSSLLSILPAAAVSFPYSYLTPFGPVFLTLFGDQSLLGMVTVTGGSLYAPTSVALAYDAIGPFANAAVALRDGGAAFNTAIQTWNAVGAATALVQTPINASWGFLFGGQEITGSTSLPSYSGYTGAAYRIPLGGLLSPLQPVTVTMFGSDGTVTTFPLSGTQVGGLFAGIWNEFTSALNAL
jgi:hypothetical protein